MRTAITATAAVALAALLAACGGGESPLGTPVATPSPVKFELTSEAIAPGAEIPVVHTCDGDNVSPPLNWPEPPPGTQSFAVIMEDPDAPGGTFTHWVLYNLLTWARGVPEGVGSARQLPEGGFHGLNDFGELGYGGPCPPPGESHRYRITLYALSGITNLTPGASKEKLLSAMEGRILAEAELEATYARPAGQ